MTRTTAFTAILLAAAIGLITHALVGYDPFPQGDDFAYAPLADFKANPALFPGDDQLRMFANHARAYEWVYWLGQAGPGVEPLFRIIVWVLAIAVSVALLIILTLLGAPIAALPVVLGLGVVVTLDGLGRGDYGGLISPFFHHHNIALALILGAAAAALSRRNGLAGVLLGIAAYAQPMTAIHGALIVGLGTLLTQPRETIRMALAALFVAAPAVWLVLSGLLATPPTPTGLDVIRDAYRFRAPHHYDPSLGALVFTTLYLLAGWVGAALLTRADAPVGRYATGMMIAFTALHLVSIVTYKLGIGEITPLFILDANRSSPLLFVLGPALAIAGIWRAGFGPASGIALILLAAIAYLNGTAEGYALIAAGAVLLALSRFDWGLKAGASAALLSLILVFPVTPNPSPVPAATRTVLEQIRAETPEDALFVIPVGLFAFRHYAQRSAYVDFKLFSVAQPDQAALTRDRINMVVDPKPENLSATGWRAVQLWDADQREAGDCATMLRTLQAADADYYLRALDAGEAPPDCDALERTITSSTLALYGLPQ